METIETLLTRRSIRKYKNQEIEKDKLDTIVKSAMYAPSAMNLQAWHYVVIYDKNVLNETIKSIPHAELLIQTPAAILVCGDAAVEKNESWMIQNCSAAIQNILLAAHGLGLGSCWIAIHGIAEVVENVSKQFKLPENVIPISLITLGYPDETVSAEDRFRKEKIHYNNW
jgi:nitroreductase